MHAAAKSFEKRRNDRGDARGRLKALHRATPRQIESAASSGAGAAKGMGHALPSFSGEKEGKGSEARGAGQAKSSPRAGLR
eukprot:1986686-Pleurochrysis_carterae.AAC.1